MAGGKPGSESPPELEDRRRRKRRRGKERSLCSRFECDWKGSKRLEEEGEEEEEEAKAMEGGIEVGWGLRDPSSSSSMLAPLPIPTEARGRGSSIPGAL